MGHLRWSGTSKGTLATRRQSVQYVFPFEFMQGQRNSLANLAATKQAKRVRVRFPTRQFWAVGFLALLDVRPAPLARPDSRDSPKFAACFAAPARDTPFTQGAPILHACSEIASW